jgi:rod shape-determining protein MreB
MALFDFNTKTVGIDPGSQYLRIIKDGEIIFNEPAQISIDKGGTTVSGIGNAINPAHAVLNPHSYVISDFQGFEALLRGALKNESRKTFLHPSYKMIFCVPTGLTEIEKRAYRDSGEHTGAVEVYMLYSNYAAAFGLNLLNEKQHFIMIEFSASRVDVSVFANGLCFTESCFRMGIGKIYSVLKNYLFRNHKISVTFGEVERMLRSLEDSNLKEIKIQHVAINRSQIDTALQAYFALVNDLIQETVERVSTHPDIGKIISNGVFLTGGGSTFAYLTRQIDLLNRVPLAISKNPQFDCVEGLKVVMPNVLQYKNYLMT